MNITTYSIGTLPDGTKFLKLELVLFYQKTENAEIVDASLNSYLMITPDTVEYQITGENEL